MCKCVCILAFVCVCVCASTLVCVGVHNVHVIESTHKVFIV